MSSKAIVQKRQSIIDIPFEESEQRALIKWAAGKLIIIDSDYGKKERLSNYMVASMNAGKRGRRQGANLKRQGMQAGFPDISLHLPRKSYHGMFVELKRIRGGRLENEQKVWIARLRAVGYHAVVAHGWVKAKEMIEDYLGE